LCSSLFLFVAFCSSFSTSARWKHRTRQQRYHRRCKHRACSSGAALAPVRPYVDWDRVEQIQVPCGSFSPPVLFSCTCRPVQELGLCTDCRRCELCRLCAVPGHQLPLAPSLPLVFLIGWSPEAPVYTGLVPGGAPPALDSEFRFSSVACLATGKARAAALISQSSNLIVVLNRQGSERSSSLLSLLP
jgi:hypothetical protein